MNPVSLEPGQIGVTPKLLIYAFTIFSETPLTAPMFYKIVTVDSLNAAAIRACGAHFIDASCLTLQELQVKLGMLEKRS